ncbi:MAG: hypothetical protein J5590_03660 [Clostridia bacterium]|nr:hypothetical protein [Clostridia bacterium]
MAHIIGKGRIKELIPEYFIKERELDREEEVDIELIDAKQLLVPERIDLICKLYYIDCFEKGINLEFAKKLYTEHIRAFSNGTFTEPGTETKNTIEKYIKTFEELIRDIKENGFDADKSVVPVGNNGAIIDGSHRTAIAIYYNIPIPIVRLKNVNVSYNYRFFRKRNLGEEYLDFMAYNYVLWADNVYVACLWPSVYNDERFSEAENLIKACAKIIYKKSVALNYNGLKQLMLHMYIKHDWIGNVKNGFSGIDGKAKPCYKEASQTTFFLLAGIELDKILELKEKIRGIFKIENHSIHITDTKDEAIEAGRIVFNKNSIELLNYGEPLKYKALFENIINFKSDLSVNNCNPDEYIVGGDSVLALYGLRNSDKVEYFSDNSKCVVLEKSKEYTDIGNQLPLYPASLEEMLYKPADYAYYMNIKFVSLNLIKSMKEKKNNACDKNDLKLIKAFEKKTQDTSWGRKLKTHIITSGKKNAIIGFALKVYGFLRCRMQSRS